MGTLFMPERIGRTGDEETGDERNGWRTHS